MPPAFTIMMRLLAALALLACAAAQTPLTINGPDSIKNVIADWFKHCPDYCTEEGCGPDSDACVALNNRYGRIEDWDTKDITHMDSLCYAASSFGLASRKLSNSHYTGSRERACSTLTSVSGTSGKW